jgi:hypothetical protein
MKPCLYVNPNATQDMKNMFAETFPDVERVNPELIEDLVRGFTDDGPPVAAYAAALIDETGKLTLYCDSENNPHPGRHQCNSE